METRFSLELRKVILEKFYASELGNLKEKITEDLKYNAYKNADAKWAKAKGMLSQIQETSIKMQWRVFENEYLLKKRVFQNDQRDTQKKLKEFQEIIITNVRNDDYLSADSNWIERTCSI